MTYHRTLVVFTCLCAVLLQLAHALESTAQPRLVPVTCNNNETYPGLSCLDSLFVEEGTIPPDSCELIVNWFSHGDVSILSLLFTNTKVLISFPGSSDHAAEYKALSGTRGVVDSAHSYLLSDHVRTFLDLFEESVEYESVVASGISPSNLDMGVPFTFYVEVPRPNHYNYWKVMKMWASVLGVDTSDVRAVQEAQALVNSANLHLAEPCLVAVSVRESDDREAHAPPRVSHGFIPLSDVRGRFTLFDISGRMVAKGEVLPGVVSDPIPVSQGLYVLVSATKASTIMVLP